VEALRVVRGSGSHIFRHSAHRCRQGSQSYASPPGRFLVLISVRGWVDPRAIVLLEGLGKLKKSTSSGTRTGDLPACSMVPQPTTACPLPCSHSTPKTTCLLNNFYDSLDGRQAHHNFSTSIKHHKHTINTDTSMARVGFQLTIPVFGSSKAVLRSNLRTWNPSTHTHHYCKPRFNGD
jgi:hypothetical protein